MPRPPTGPIRTVDWEDDSAGPELGGHYNPARASLTQYREGDHILLKMAEHYQIALFLEFFSSVNLKILLLETFTKKIIENMGKF